MEKRTAKQFSRKEVAFIAKSYADTSNGFDYKDYTESYNISKHTFYKLLERAVVENIVETDVVKGMYDKSLFNVGIKHEGKGAQIIKKHYEDIWARRQNYMIPEIAALQLIKEYANSDLTKQAFCEEYAITKNFFSAILKKYIVTDKISDETFEKLSKKGLKNNFSKDAMNFWSELIAKRKSNLSRGK